VEVRNPLPGDDDSPRGHGTREQPSDVRYDAEGRASLRVPTFVIVVKAICAALIAFAATFAPQRPQLVVGLIAAAAVATYAARDVVARERLRVDTDGLRVVRGYAGHRHLAWNDIERLRVDHRTRLGARADALEIDADTEIYLLTRNDLGAEPEDALAILERFRQT
jgi:hypothetical protein